MKNVDRIDIQQAVTDSISLELEESSAESCDDNEIKGFIYRNTFSLLNVDQLVGLKNLPNPLDLIRSDRDDAVDTINRVAKVYCANAGLFVCHRGVYPCYSPTMDVIEIPTAFCDEKSSYAADLAHQLIFSTGHEKRLNRFSSHDESFKWCKETYAFENLIATLGAAFICAELGIQGKDQQCASYINNSTRILESDKTFIFKAAVAANQAYCYLIGLL
jgi:antirestriction protein ArdC